MSGNEILQLVIYLAVLFCLVKPLGSYIATIYEGRSNFMVRVLGPLERWTYKICHIRSEQEMNWKEYAISMLLFNLMGFIAVYLIQRLQGILPLNPQHFPAVNPDLAFNTATSFIANTNWQAYGGENTLSYFTQMAALTVQNFLSAATGISILMALIRGIRRCETTALGNFWVDIVRGILYLFLPLSILLSLLLVSQGVIQNFKPYQSVSLIQAEQYQDPQLDETGQQMKDAKGDLIFRTKTLIEQQIPMGPAASQVAIKQLGTNGGGFFNVNSAHPFENPTPLSNFFEMLAILLMPAALCYTYGVMVRKNRQGWAILVTMSIILIPLICTTFIAEKQTNPAIEKIAQDIILPDGGNMEGKETRFGILNSSIWATATTATGNGSVNAMLDSFLPVGGLIPLWLMDLAEVIFGGVGSGLYQMIIFILITVFVSGLMVGRTPEYMGKKIEAFEMKMAAVAIFVMPLTVLLCTAIAVLSSAGLSALANPGAHGFSEILYAFSSMTNNNGSAFAGLNSNISFYTTLGGFAILIGRYWIAIAILAIAGSLAGKKTIPASSGTLPTDSITFGFVLIGVILIMGALIFFPAFALGPIVEQFMLAGHL